MTEMKMIRLVCDRLQEVPGENIVPEPFGHFFRTLAKEMLDAMDKAGKLVKTGEILPLAILRGRFSEEKLAEAESCLPEGLHREILFALWQEEKGLWLSLAISDEAQIFALVSLFLEIYGAFQDEDLPDPEALRRDYRSYILDYLPERALFYVRCELDLMEEATIPQVPPGPYQEHLLAEAAALVGHWRVHLTNEKQTIIGKQTASIAADSEMLPAAAYVRRMLRGLGVRSSMLVRSSEIAFAAPWVAECGASVPHAQTADARTAIFEEALARLPAASERVMALFLDENFVSRRLRAEEEALREIDAEVFAGHVGTLRIVAKKAAGERPGERYFSERQRELYLELVHELAAIRKRFMKARPFICEASEVGNT